MLFKPLDLGEGVMMVTTYNGMAGDSSFFVWETDTKYCEKKSLITFITPIFKALFIAKI